jgi:hypothetical protein
LLESECERRLVWAALSFWGRIEMLGSRLLSIREQARRLI